MEENQENTAVYYTVPKPTPPKAQTIKEGVNPNRHHPVIKDDGRWITRLKIIYLMITDHLY